MKLSRKNVLYNVCSLNEKSKLFERFIIVFFWHIIENNKSYIENAIITRDPINKNKINFEKTLRKGRNSISVFAACKSTNRCDNIAEYVFDFNPRKIGVVW